MSKAKSGIMLGIILFLTAIFAVLDFIPFEIPFYKNGIYDYQPISSTIGLGIDLKGGYSAVLQPQYTDEQKEAGQLDELFEGAVDILRARLDNKGYNEATINIEGVGDAREIRVEIPDVDNARDILEVIGSSGKLTFSNTSDGTGKVYLEGSDIKSSQAGKDSNGQPIIYLEFNDSGIAKFSNATKELLGQTMYILLDNEYITGATVNEQITNSTAQITGISSMEEAETIAAVINAGKLDFSFTIRSSGRISATLGENALSASIIAGAIALVLVFAIMILFYRGLGVAASIALLIYTVVLIILLALVPWVQLTLPGIAGIILSIGMAVDANVIIFEAIKDEYNSGKTVASAIKNGFKSAFVTILDSNVTTILASIVLWILCPGSIKGFAITLFIGIILSMLTSIVVSKVIVKLLGNLSEGSAKFFGLTREVEEDVEA